MIQTCIRCQKDIDLDTHFVEITEWNDRNVEKQNYMHFSCWEETMDSKSKVSEAMGMLGIARKIMKKQGLLPDEQVIIK